MARIFQIVGWAFVVVGIMFMGLMGIMAVDGPPLSEAAGSVWFKLNPYSLGQFQVLIQRTLHLPDFWDGYIVPILGSPAWRSMVVIAVVSFVLGAVLLAMSRNRRRAGIIHQNNMS